MAEFTQITKTAEIEEQHGKCFEVNGKKIAVFNRGGGRFCALDDACTHMGASLAEGAVTDENVICPWHGALFNLESGAMSGPPARSNVARYPCRVVEDHVEVEL